MAVRHSDRHLDPHGHRHGPRRDELHGGRIALGLRLCSAPSTVQHGHHKRSTPAQRGAATHKRNTPQGRALGRAYEEVVPTM